MIKQFNQSYPPPVPNQKTITTALFFGLFIGLFLIFFEPFDLNLSTYKYKNIALLTFGLITTIVLFISLYLIPKALPNLFSESKWTVFRHIVFYGIILFVIATLNGIYTNYLNNLQFSWSNYWWIINRTFLLGGIPIAFLTVLDHNRKLKRHYKDAEQVLNGLQTFESIDKENVWGINTDLKNETIPINEESFFYAMAIGNYVEIYTYENNEVRKETYRISLGSLELQLPSKNLRRCHRSYLVNIKKIEGVSGKAQGLKLKLINLSYTIPVSRKYIPEIKKHLK